MRNTTVAAFIAATALLTAGCSSASPTDASHKRTAASAVRSQIPFPSPVPTAPPTPCTSGPYGQCLALVIIGNQIVVRDITTIGHPKTLSTPPASMLARFVDQGELSYIKDCSLFREAISGSPSFGLETSRACVMDFDWSPDGSSYAYIVPNNQQTTDVHIVRPVTDRLVATVTALPRTLPCDSQACQDANDLQLVYSPDGGVVMLEQHSTSTFRIWTSAGEDVTPALGKPFMPVWSGSSLFFQDAKGIEVFRGGTVSPFLPGVTWIRPKASPMGGQIVYESRDAAGLAHSYMVDTKSAKVREFGAGRAEPVFLTPRLVWYQGERLCLLAENCLADNPVKLTGKTYIYDLQDGTETDSIITRVLDVWPHPA
jgi:hypothetical protein